MTSLGANCRTRPRRSSRIVCAQCAALLLSSLSALTSSLRGTPPTLCSGSCSGRVCSTAVYTVASIPSTPSWTMHSGMWLLQCHRTPPARSSQQPSRNSCLLPTLRGSSYVPEVTACDASGAYGSGVSCAQMPAELVASCGRYAHRRGDYVAFSKRRATRSRRHASVRPGACRSATSMSDMRSASRRGGIHALLCLRHTTRACACNTMASPAAQGAPQEALGVG